MEKVLYDIYLADAEINNNYTIFANDSARKQNLLNSVLKKHKITETVLETSLAWYSGHLDKYVRINDNISKRYVEVTEKLRSKEEIIAKVNTDQTVLPVNRDRFLLSIFDLNNNARTFKADTVLNRYGGTYELQFDILGLPASFRPVITLCVQCNDTLIVKRDTINRGGLFSTSVEIFQVKQAKNIFGSIYFPEIYPETTVFVQNFTLSHRLISGNLSIAQPAE